MNKNENIPNNEEQKKIEVITGNGDDLNISPVYKHLEVEKPRKKENRAIVIPKVKDNISRTKS